MMQNLIIIGAGGLGQELVWAARATNERSPCFEFCGFCDDDPLKKGKQVAGLPVWGTIEDYGKQSSGDIFFACGVGDNRRREYLVNRAEKIGWRPAAILDPSVVIGPGVEVGEGSYIAALSVLSPNSRVGRHVVINHGCSIGHDARIDDFGQVCPGGRISGFCVLGRGAFVGSNGVVAPGTELGEHAVLGAASFTSKAIPPGATAVGNPARVIYRTD